MQPEPGTLLLHYRLIEKVGEGGMGVVWRALDTTLDRQVAVKILPDVFASDPDRAARFEREAKVLASLNHPNITHVHSVHHADGVRFLVMEFAHGENLADRIGRGRIPIDEALVIAKQIALAIEAAHESSVIHRDLKPANVTVTEANKVEVLDFGLAKAFDAAGAGSAPDHLTKSPTVVSGHTAAGMILGTAAYMSPEQARGKSVDRRTDIWSFGCVLYEMLAGRRAFDGETVTDVLAAVVTRDPDWSQIPPGTPERIRELLRRCLEKDPQRRLRDAGEIRIAVEDVMAHPRSDVIAPVEMPHAAPAARPRRALVPWLVTALLLAVVIGLLTVRRDPERVPTHLSVALPPTDVLEGGPENLVMNISPDGRTIAYAARRGSSTALFVRRLGDREPAALEGTDEAHSPFFSPDGQWIAFVSRSKLRKVSINGGPVFDICDVSADRSGVWLDDGSIIISTHATVPLSRVSSSGGALQAVSVLDTIRGERTHRWPDAFPGGEWVLFTVGHVNSPGNYESATIEAVSLRTGERRLLVENASMARYCHPGYLIFSRAGALLAAPIDPSNPKRTGAPVPVLDRIDREPSSGAVQFAVARSGTLAFAPRVEGSEQAEIVWISHEGAITVVPAPAREYVSPRISPDGQQICVAIGPAYGLGDLWRYDIARESLTRLTFEGTGLVGYWSPDQRRIVFQHEATGFNISSLSLEGDAAPERIYQRKEPMVISGLTPDGGTVLFSQWGTRDGDILQIPVSGGEPEVIINEAMDQSDARVSPDGQWVAYTTRATGVLEVFVRSYPPGPNKWQVSTGGGSMATWSPVRRELYWIGGNTMMAATYEVSGRNISFDRPRALFTLPPGRGNDADVLPYDVSPDGSRFLMTRMARPEFARRRIDVVLDFPARLESLEKEGAQP